MALSVLIGLLFTIVSGDHSVRNISSCGTQTYQPHTPPTQKSITTRIVGGREAVPHSWPWMVVLRFRTSTLTCGGSIIRTSSGELVILTAAQCVDGTIAADWHVDTGVHSREAHEENQKTYTVSAIIRHEDFNPYYLENDIAILRVSPAIVENDYTRPICVTNIPSSAFWGKQCVVTGWGSTVEGGLPADKLKEVYKPVLSDSTCLTNVGGAYNVDHMVCAGYLEGGKGACAGDNGGPLACKNADGQYDLIGIVSWGFGCARQGLPAVYANVHKYLDWIGNKTTIN